MTRQFQFSLRTLLVAVFAACLVAHLANIAVRNAVGSVGDLPAAERLALGSINSHGIAVVDHFT